MNFPDNLFTLTYKLPLFLTNPLSDNIRYLTNRAPDGARHLPLGKGESHVSTLSKTPSQTPYSN